MAKLSKETLVKFIGAGFFDDWKTLDEVIKRLSQKGFTIKSNKAGLVAQLLTYLCQDDILEREEIPGIKNAAKWKYRKYQNAKSNRSD